MKPRDFVIVISLPLGTLIKDFLTGCVGWRVLFNFLLLGNEMKAFLKSVQIEAYWNLLIPFFLSCSQSNYTQLFLEMCFPRISLLSSFIIRLINWQLPFLWLTGNIICSKHREFKASLNSASLKPMWNQCTSTKFLVPISQPPPP